MLDSTKKFVRKASNKLVHSIAFYPAVISLAFLLIAVIALELDLHGFGELLNIEIKWLTLKDADTARTIVATIAAALISVTVFSFSMVMVVMNQAASQMSNRMLDIILGDKTQKLVLGFYIGTIVYSLFLLSNISETEENLKVPSFSIYLALLITILDMFLFVYYMHHVTQFFRYEQIIQEIHKKTVRSLKHYYSKCSSGDIPCLKTSQIVSSDQTGYFQRISHETLIRICTEHDMIIKVVKRPGEYVLKGEPILHINCEEKLPEQLVKKILLGVDFFYGQQIDNNPFYGFFHLREVAVKALSPGINDPGTAVLCINVLTGLLLSIRDKPSVLTFADAAGKPRILLQAYSLDDLFKDSVLPIFNYGKNDIQVCSALSKLTEALMKSTTKEQNVPMAQLYSKLKQL